MLKLFFDVNSFELLCIDLPNVPTVMQHLQCDENSCYPSKT